MDWIKSPDLDIQARILRSFKKRRASPEEKRTARFTCVSLWYTGWRFFFYSTKFYRHLMIPLMSKNLFFLESRYYSFWLVLIGQSIRSAGPFLALRNPFHLRWGSRLPARQIRMQELELLYPQHPSKRDAFTRAFHQKEAFAPLPLFCGSRRNKHRVVSGLLY